jgi:hypothetical protein
MPSHAHATTGGGGVDHLHQAGSASGDHAHTATFLAGPAGTGGNSFVRTAGSTGTVGGTVGAPAGNHTHTSGAADRSLDHNHGITAQGGGAPVPTVPIHVLMSYIVRAI